MINEIGPRVLALGDSLTAGYGLDPSASFAARLQALLCERHPGTMVHNAGVSGDTTSAALARLPKLLSSLRYKPDLAIVELGANDLLRGVPPRQTRADLDTILSELGRCDIPVLLATFEVPPFLGAFAAHYDGIYAAVAAKYGVATMPFFPEGVIGHPELVLADRLHPNARAIELVVNAFLPAVLEELDRHRAQAA